MRKISRVVLITFLLFFPLVGIYLSWLHSHNVIQTQGIDFAGEVAPTILEDWDFQPLYDYGTLTIKGTIEESEFNSLEERWGEFESIGEFMPDRSWIADRGDMRWHFAELEAPVTFSEGEAILHFTAARRTMSQKEWRIEEFELVPVK